MSEFIPSWDQWYMGLARYGAMRSKDPRTKVCGIFVDERHRVISLGYNGMPYGTKDTEEVWKPENKYTRVSHAELNAVLNCKGRMGDFVKSTLYVTLFPCSECAKILASLRIGRVVYLDKRDGEDTSISEQTLAKAGIVLEKYQPVGRTITFTV